MTENKTASGSGTGSAPTITTNTTTTTIATTASTTLTTSDKKFGYTTEAELIKEYSEQLKDPANLETAVNYLLHSIIDENIHGTALEVHQASRIGSIEAMEGEPEDIKPYSINEMSNIGGVFGTSNSKKTAECNCPYCNRLVAAARFAPHLANCMGMGRNSSRIASLRLANAREGTTNFFSSTNSGDDDDDAYWPSEKRKRKPMSNMRANGSKKNGKS